MIFFSPAKNVERLLRVDVSVVIVDFFERKIAFSNSLRVYAYFLCSRLSIQSSLHTINVFCLQWWLKRVNARVSRFSFHFVIPPNSNTFSDWRRTCHVSLVKTSWRPRANKTSWRPRATTTWTFDSHVIRSCTFETAANLYASRRQANNFYLCIVLFWVGRYNKTLNDWPLGKQWVLFPLDLNVSLGFASGEHWGSRGNKTHCFPWGQSLSA